MEMSLTVLNYWHSDRKWDIAICPVRFKEMFRAIGGHLQWWVAHSIARRKVTMLWVIYVKWCSEMLCDNADVDVTEIVCISSSSGSQTLDQELACSKQEAKGASQSYSWKLWPSTHRSHLPYVVSAYWPLHVCLTCRANRLTLCHFCVLAVGFEQHVLVNCDLCAPARRSDNSFDDSGLYPKPGSRFHRNPLYELATHPVYVLPVHTANSKAESGSYGKSNCPEDSCTDE
jgi:hypothetical protein